MDENNKKNKFKHRKTNPSRTRTHLYSKYPVWRTNFFLVASLTSISTIQKFKNMSRAIFFSSFFICGAINEIEHLGRNQNSVRVSFWGFILSKRLGWTCHISTSPKKDTHRSYKIYLFPECSKYTICTLYCPFNIFVFLNGVYPYSIHQYLDLIQ